MTFHCESCGRDYDDGPACCTSDDCPTIIRRRRVYPNCPYPWTSVVIEDGKDSKFVTILSTIHKTRELRLTHSYALSFSDGKILADRDFLSAVRRFA